MDWVLKEEDQWQIISTYILLGKKKVLKDHGFHLKSPK